jgi:hypothetical protein
MYLAHVIQSRKGRVWAVLVALAVVGILIATFVVLSGRSPRPFEMDDLYGVLD